MKKKFSLKPTFEVNTGDFWGIKNLSKPKALLAMAALAALGNVLGFVMIPIGPQAKLDLTTLPLLIVACLYGPLPAFISGILGSLPREFDLDCYFEEITEAQLEQIYRWLRRDAQGE